MDYMQKQMYIIIKHVELGITVTKKDQNHQLLEYLSEIEYYNLDHFININIKENQLQYN